ncbi:MAG: alpha/beta hydrolase [Candidatus Heimdallarchaeota archaeon]|nr:alpha/beta hydrolase [Candidatus Heimdallarchaeota archaeon]MCK4878016.1 alpha/beta hydrolase [Candidatus Heimdallarchaeota archaeon]
MENILKRLSEVETKLLTLSDGRKVSYLDIGDPKGTPILYFHGSPGSRYEALFAEKSAISNNLRIIAPDRPGFGDSDFKPNYSLLDYNNDIIEIVDQLNVSKFGTAGVSGGGTIVLSLAYEYSNRLLFAIDISGYAPVHKTELSKIMAPLDKLFIRIGKISPRLFKLAYSYMGRIARKKSPQKFSKMLKSAYSEQDAEILQDEEMAKFLKVDMEEAFKNGADGPSWDAINLYSDWGFKLQDINFKIHLFHGIEDITVPLKFAEYKAEHLQNSSYTEYKNEGHFMFVRKFEEILSEVIQ